MNKQWLEFCRKYKEKLKNDITLSGKDIFGYSERKYTSRISFHLSIFTQGHSYSDTKQGFILDEDDLKYFYNKYSNKLNEELALEKQKLDEEYKAAVELYTIPNADKQE